MVDLTKFSLLYRLRTFGPDFLRNRYANAGIAMRYLIFAVA